MIDKLRFSCWWSISKRFLFWFLVTWDMKKENLHQTVKYCMISLIKRGRTSLEVLFLSFSPLHSTDVDRSGCYSLLSNSSGSMCILVLHHKLNLQRRSSSHFPRSNMFALLKSWTKNYVLSVLGNKYIELDKNFRILDLLPSHQSNTRKQPNWATPQII